MSRERDLIKQELGAGLARRLRAKRLALGLSVDGLASKAGCGRAQIVRLERGDGGATGIDTVALLATGLGVSPAWLAFGIGDGE